MVSQGATVKKKMEKSYTKNQVSKQGIKKSKLSHQN